MDSKQGESAHQSNPGVGGANPNYYAETSAPQSQAEQHFPPPPPGPPPARQDQQYYPPPPPGPPPNSDYHPLQSNPPPPYSPPADPNFHVPGDEKPPALPPRAAGAQAQQQTPYFPPPPTQETQPQQQQTPYFAPPPTQADVPQQQPQETAQASTSSSGKKTFGERFYQWGIKAGVPINKITNKLGAEAFWPTSMDKECDKAARILKSFCKDGFYTKDSNRRTPSPGDPNTPGPSKSGKTLVKVPSKVIQQAKGIAIFTTFRTGLHISGAGGSGVVVARLPDGSWSPPSGFLVHTLGGGFLIGLDIYDCVAVLNTDEAVRAFTHPRVSLGGELAVAAGPVGAGGSLEGAITKAPKPVWTYMKSRGFYAGVQVDGTIIIQRPDANAAFFGEKLTVEQILKGQVKSTGGKVQSGQDQILMWPDGAEHLMEVLKAAEGKQANTKVVENLGTGPTPGDLASTEGVHPEGKAAEAARYA